MIGSIGSVVYPGYTGGINSIFSTKQTTATSSPTTPTIPTPPPTTPTTLPDAAQPDVEPVDQLALTLAQIEEKLVPFLTPRSEYYSYDQANIDALESALANWPDDDPLFEHLTAREAKIAFVNYVISIKENSNEHEYVGGAVIGDDYFTCHDFALQTYLDLTDGIVDISNLGGQFSQPSLPAKYHMPINIFGVITCSNAGTGGHAINAVLVGENKNNLNDWYVFEPQEDRGFQNIESLMSYLQATLRVDESDCEFDINAPTVIDGNNWNYDAPNGLHFYIKPGLAPIQLASRGQITILLYAIHFESSRFVEILELDDDGFYTTENFKAVFELGIREGLLTMDYLQNAVQAMQGGQRKRELTRFLGELATATIVPDVTQADINPADHLTAILPQIEEKLVPFLSSRDETYPYDQTDVDALESVLALWPDDVPVYDHLTSRESKIAFVNYVISVKDNTNEREYIPIDDDESSNHFVCHHFALQTYINLTNSEVNLSQMNAILTAPTLPAMYRLPIYIFSEGRIAHATNAVLIGDNESDLNDWYFFEPQLDLGHQGLNLVELSNTPISFSRPGTINDRYYDWDDNAIRFFVKSNSEIVRLMNMAQSTILHFAVILNYSDFAEQILNLPESDIHSTANMDPSSLYTTANFKSTFELAIREGLLTMDYLQNAVQAMQGGQRKRELMRFLGALASEVVDPSQPGQ